MQPQQPPKTLTLVFGATGRSGFHITNRLLQSPNHQVRIVVRSKDKAKKLFKLQNPNNNKFESVLEGSLNDESLLSQAFKQSPIHGRVKLVISSLGCEAAKSENDVQQLQQTTQCNIVDLCISNKVDQYVLISAALIERPYNPITVALNTIVPNVYKYKIQTQNYIRRSQLKSYIIVRPPQLIGEFDTDKQIMGYNLDQGDKILGKISRRTLSEVVLHAIKAKYNGAIPEKVTFECQREENKKECTPEDFRVLKADDESSILKADHKTAKRVYWMTVILGMICVGYIGYKKYFGGASGDL